MPEIVLFPNTRHSTAAELDEDLVRRDVRDCLDRIPLLATQDTQRAIADAVARLVVEELANWVSGYVFASEIKGGSTPHLLEDEWAQPPRF